MSESITETRTYRTTNNADTFTHTLTGSGNSIERATPSVPVAKSGTVATQTNTTHGVVTMAGGHGFATNNVVDLFWTDGGRHGMTATVSANTVTLDGGSGDSFPAVNTAVGAMIPTEVAMAITANTAVGIGVSSPVPGWIAFCDGSGEIAAATYRVTTGGQGDGWVTGNGISQPLNTTTTKVKFSHGNTTSAQTMKAAVVFNP